MNSDIRTSRYGLGMIMKTGWIEFIKNWKTIITIALLIYAPLNILGLYSANFLFLRAVMDLLLVASVSKVIEESVNGNNILLSDALRFACRRWIPALCALLQIVVTLLILALFLVIPAIVYFPRFIFGIYATVLRELPSGKGLDYSNDLVKGQWWRVLIYTLAIMLGGCILGMIVLSPASSLPVCKILSFFWWCISDILYLPFSVMMVIFFLNCDFLKHKPADIPEQL